MASSPAISAAFPFASRDVEVLGSNLHYVDEGAGDPILFLHGQPTSSYLWRNIIPYLTPYGRCIALDLIGFGKSDKPDLDYRFVTHAQYVDGFINALDLKKITLVLHDRGSNLGFHYFARYEANVKALAFMEATFMDIDLTTMDEPNRLFFGRVRGEHSWDVLVNQNLFLEEILASEVVRKLTDEELARYREPFLSPTSRKPIWRWPQEVSIDGQPADVAEAVEAYKHKLMRSDLPKLLFYGTPGLIVPASLVEWCERNLKNLKTVGIGPGLHFLQEDNPHLIGAELAAWYQTL